MDARLTKYGFQLYTKEKEDGEPKQHNNWWTHKQIKIFDVEKK